MIGPDASFPLSRPQQKGAPFTAPLTHLERRISNQIHCVVDLVLTKSLTALEHGTIENFIIAEVGSEGGLEKRICGRGTV